MILTAKISTVAAIVLLVSAIVPAGRYQVYTEEHQHPENPLIPVTASFIGGEGSEWLVGGGFGPEGEIVVVGNTLGPAFSGPGAAPVEVLGSDETQPGPLKLSNYGHPSSAGSPCGDQPMDFRHPNGTVFISKFNGQTGVAEKTVRMPWMSGSGTHAVLDEAGNIYFTGIVGPNPIPEMIELSGVPTDELIDKYAQRTNKDSYCRGGEFSSAEGNGYWHVFLCKARPDLSGIEWMRSYHAVTRGHEIFFGADGTIHLGVNPSVVFDSEGNNLGTRFTTTGGKEWIRTVYPHVEEGATGRYNIAIFGELGGYHFWHNGNLWLDSPTEGGKYDFLYQWDTDFAHTDALYRLDRAHLNYVEATKEDVLLLAASTEGDQSSYSRQPWDPFEPLGFSGLGWNVEGARRDDLINGLHGGKGGFTMPNVVKCYENSPIVALMKMDRQSNGITALTHWCGFDPSTDGILTTRIRDLHLAGDGTLVAYGQGEGGIIQTEGKLVSEDGPGGYLTVFDNTLQEIRYSTRLPGTGMVRRFMRTAVAEQSYGAIAHRIVNNRLRVLFVTSADDEAQEATSENAAQKDFGGGDWDGFFLVLEGAPDPATPVTQAQTKPGVSPDLESASTPEDGTAFILGNEFPQFDNVSIALRDKNKVYLPNFFWGYFTEDRSFTWSGEPQIGPLGITARKMTNRGGKAARRILGSLAGDNNNKPSLSAELNIEGNPQQSGDAFTASASGTLKIENETAQMSGIVTISPVWTPARNWVKVKNRPDNAPPPEKRFALHYQYALECGADDLGIAAGGRETIVVTIDVFAYPTEELKISPAFDKAAKGDPGSRMTRTIYDIRGRRIDLSGSTAIQGAQIPKGVYLSDRAPGRGSQKRKLVVR